MSAFTYDPDGRLLQTRQSAGGTVLATVSSSYTPSGKLASTRSTGSPG
jgi:YD repeat-containing protein